MKTAVADITITDLSGSTDTDQEEMTLDLTEDTIDTKDVVQDVVEQHQRHVELFFVDVGSDGVVGFAAVEFAPTG